MEDDSPNVSLSLPLPGRCFLDGFDDTDIGRGASLKVSMLLEQFRVIHRCLRHASCSPNTGSNWMRGVTEYDSDGEHTRKSRVPCDGHTTQLSNCHRERESLAEASSMRDGKPIQWFAPYRADSRD